MFFPTLDDAGSALLDAFEERLHLDPAADLVDFLPVPTSADYAVVATELARIDMEYAWERGAPRRPEHYFAAIPGLRSNPTAVAALAFEDYRLRKLAGRPVTPDQYAVRYSISVMGWPIDPNSDRESDDPLLEESVLTPLPAKPLDSLRTMVVNPPTDPLKPAAEAATAAPSPPPEDSSWDATSVVGVRKLPQVAVKLPDLGTTFLGFELLEELGRGTFGRVYLARQPGLAGRCVALKVARGLFSESQTLAQLQHTNIVPIYSMHDAGPLQAVCMPYFGRCTLSHVFAEIRARGMLPTSGEQLIGTMRHGRTMTRPEPGTVALYPVPAHLVAEAVADTAHDGTDAPTAAPKHAAWARLAGMTYTDAVVWVGSQLAAGLVHAHQRGILHRDLKPANVLLTDDGVPMLLDFNIAEDTKRRGLTTTAIIGGTLPYMAPEQMQCCLDAATLLDGRADIYALGIILFEMLTGRRPYPDRSGEQDDAIRMMLADRAGPVPHVRELNPHVPASVESIVRKCLAAHPAQRYQSAADLHEDLLRHLQHQPLRHASEPSLRERARKWARRHPRLASGSTVAAAAGLLVVLLAGGLYAARERSRALEVQAFTLEARVALGEHDRDFTTLHELLDDRNQTRESLDRGLELCRQALARYDIPTEADALPPDWDRARLIAYLPDADRERLRDDFGEVFYLLAKTAARRAEMAADAAERAHDLATAIRWNRLAEAYGQARIPRAIHEQRADLARFAGRSAEAAEWLAVAAATPPASPRDRYLVGYWHHHQGRYRQAAADLEAATAANPTSFSAWFVRGVNHLALEQNDLAAMCFTACVALRADFAPVWINRGIALARLKKLTLALDDYAQAARLAPDAVDVMLLQAGVYQALGRDTEAVALFTRALDTPTCPSRVYFYRASSRQRLGDADGSIADEAEGLKRNPTDELSWIARAETKALHGDPHGALADVEQALRVNPRSLPALQLKAHLLSEHLNDPAGAIRALDRAIELYPDNAPARAGRGVLRARGGNRDGAIADAETALLLETGGSNLYQVGCIFAITAKTHPADRFRALELIASALRAGFGAEYLAEDPDLDAIRRYPEFQKLTPPR